MEERPKYERHEEDKKVKRKRKDESQVERVTNRGRSDPECRESTVNRLIIHTCCFRHSTRTDPLGSDLEVFQTRGFVFLTLAGCSISRVSTSSSTQPSAKDRQSRQHCQI